MRRHNKIFYVYEYWRSDTNEPFYVGKGKGKQAYALKKDRNTYFLRIVAKLSRLGMCVEVRMIEHGLPECEAFALEKVRIAFWRARGIKLANMTDGGEGSSGFRFTKEQRKMLGDTKRGKHHIHPRQGKPLSVRHCKAISNGKRGKPIIALRGKSKSLDHRKNIGAALRGRIFTAEHCKRISEAKQMKIKLVKRR